MIQLSVNKKFLIELAQLPAKDRERIERFIFDDKTGFEKLSDIPGLVKLKGYSDYYRIRFGDYRAGLKFKNGKLSFERLVHRKDIYKFYP